VPDADVPVLLLLLLPPSLMVLPDSFLACLPCLRPSLLVLVLLLLLLLLLDRLADFLALNGANGVG
jgi:hypothetical protein